MTPEPSLLEHEVVRRTYTRPSTSASASASLSRRIDATTNPAIPTTAVLVTEADREAAVRRIGECFVEGVLTHAELDARLGRALSARTCGDLLSASGDLPRRQAPPFVRALRHPSTGPR